MKLSRGRQGGARRAVWFGVGTARDNRHQHLLVQPVLPHQRRGEPGYGQLVAQDEPPGRRPGAVQLVEVIPDRFMGAGVIVRLELGVGATEKPHFRSCAG